PYVARPLVFWHDTRITIPPPQRAHIFTGFLALPCSTTIPPITGAQAEALDAARFLAEKHALGLRFLQGAIQ
ncbi:hypothetical protein BJ912DRAFT_814284, partial [Pholiota molesta]